MDFVDPLIHVVVEERRVDSAPDGVVLETLRPGYRTARGLVVCKAAVAVNRILPVAAALLGVTQEKIIFKDGFVFAGDATGWTVTSGRRQNIADQANAPGGRVPPSATDRAKLSSRRNR